MLVSRVPELIVKETSGPHALTLPGFSYFSGIAGNNGETCMAELRLLFEPSNLVKPVGNF